MAISSAVGGGVDIAGALGAFNAPTPTTPSWQDLWNEGAGASTHTTEMNLQLDPLLANSQQGIEYNNIFGTPSVTSTAGGQTITQPGAPGTLSMLEQASGPLTGIAAGEASALRGSDVADMGSLGPSVYGNIRNFDPQATGLMDTLNSQAQQQLNTNGGLTPGQMRQYQQNIRGAQAARGLGQGFGDAAAEGNYIFNNQQQLRQQNQAFAGNVAQADQSMYGSPYQILGMPTPQVPGLNFQQPNSTVMQNPQNEIDQLFGNFQNAQWAQQAGNAQTEQKYIGALGGSGSGGSGGGGSGGGSGMGALAAMFL